MRRVLPMSQNATPLSPLGAPPSAPPYIASCATRCGDQPALSEALIVIATRHGRCVSAQDQLRAGWY